MYHHTVKIVAKIVEKLTGVPPESSPNLRKVVKNVQWLLFDNAVRLGLGLFVTAWLVRYLGPTQFGTLSYAIAFVALFNYIGTLGLDTIVVRNIARAPSRTNQILGTTFVLKAFGGALAFGTILGMTLFIETINPSARWLIGIIAAGMIFQTFDTIDFYFQSQVQSKYTVWAKNSAFLLLSLVKMLLILNHAPLVAFAWTGLAEIVVGALGLMGVYRMRGFSLNAWKFDLATAKNLLQDSWSVILAGIAYMIYIRIDQIMLGQIIGNAEVGVYAAAIRLAECWHIIGAIIINSTFPIIIGFKATDEALYRKKLQMIYNILVMVGVAAIIVTILTATPIIHILYGQNYIRSAGILSVYVLGTAFVFLGGASSYALLAENLQIFNLYRVILACVVNVSLNLTLIPKYGAMGSAVASVISYGVAAFSLGLFRKTRENFFMLLSSLNIFYWHQDKEKLISR